MSSKPIRSGANAIAPGWSVMDGRGVQLCTSQLGVLDLVKLEVLGPRPFGLTKTCSYTTYDCAFLFVLGPGRSGR